jgi:hypothetical protein
MYRAWKALPHMRDLKHHFGINLLIDKLKCTVLRVAYRALTNRIRLASAHPEINTRTN